MVKFQQRLEPVTPFRIVGVIRSANPVTALNDGLPGPVSIRVYRFTIGV
jgi:hypothetical protein